MDVELFWARERTILRSLFGGGGLEGWLGAWSCAFGSGTVHALSG